MLRLRVTATRWNVPALSAGGDVTVCTLWSESSKENVDGAVGADVHRVRDVVVRAVAEHASTDQALRTVEIVEHDADLDRQVAGEVEGRARAGVEVRAPAGDVDAVGLLVGGGEVGPLARRQLVGRLHRAVPGGGDTV